MNTQETKIYKSIVQELLAIDEDYGYLLALKLSKLVAIALLSDRERQIYNEITLGGISTSKISDILGLKTKNVSSTLIHLESKLSFVRSKLDDKGNRIWFTTILIT